MSSVADIVNRAMDMVGRRDLIIGDIEEGTEGAQVALRLYTPCLEQLLRAAHWAFARKAASLTMLADATGQTAGVGTTVIAPWVYEYAWPIDALQMRFVPQNYLNPNQTIAGNISLPTAPLTTVSQPPFGTGMRLIPAPFLVSSDTNYNVDPNSNWADLQGLSPVSRTVVLTNVNQAVAIYTALMIYPSEWDALFEQAMVNLLTTRMALPLAKDQKFGLAVQDRADKALMGALTSARAASANESGFPQTIDNIPDFIRTRRSGGGWGLNGGFGAGLGYDGPGCLWGGFGGLSLGNGSVF